jgi:hypothetical protein
MKTSGKTRSGVPYQYNMDNKKRTITDREGLASNEEEVEDIRVMENIEEILHATYESKIGDLGSGTKEELQSRSSSAWNLQPHV